MTKQELYKAAVAVYKETGQGLPGRLLRAHSMGSAIDELIAEGRLQSIRESNAYLPNEEWICLTKGYCMEASEETVDNLNFIRVFLNVPMLVNSLGDGEFPIEEALADKEFMAKYNCWKIENEASLNEIATITDEY